MLQRLSAAGGIAGLPVSAGAAATPGEGGAATADDDGVSLGDFESGLDGWTTNGGNELSRLRDSVGVASGEHCLRVDVEGDLYPEIENNDVRDADFLSNPYLQLRAIAVAGGTDSDLTFRFRLHHAPTGTGKGAKGGPGSKGGPDAKRGNPNVATSEPKTLPQLTAQRIQWDMSGLPDAVLESARRLEIAWYLDEHEPSGKQEGRAKGAFSYEGIVLFDDVRLTDSNPTSGVVGRGQKLRQLHRNHGRLDRREVDERGEGSQRGRLVFADGAEFAYSYADREGYVEYTLDGETFELEGI